MSIVIDKNKIIKNPSIFELDEYFNKNTLGVLKGLITKDNLYCWKSISCDYTKIVYELKIDPLCGIIFNRVGIRVANFWKNKNFDSNDIGLILHHPILEKLFKKDYKIIGL